MRRICVYCGSSPGARPEYLAVARDLGTALVERGIGLVYGGARVGAMGEIATAVLRAGGDVIGVIPRALAEREVAFAELPDLRVVGSMHERKAVMAELADGFVALPGGFGTIEEIAEMLTWSQLGIHTKPCGVVNVAGFFDHFVAFIEHAVAERFVHPANRSLLLVSDSPTDLLDRFAGYRPQVADKATWAIEASERRDSAITSARAAAADRFGEEQDSPARAR